MSDITAVEGVFVGIAAITVTGLIGYSLYSCYKSEGGIGPGSLFKCLLKGGGSVGIDLAKDLGKSAWKDIIKPGWNKALKPIGKSFFNKALKPGFKEFKKLPKQLEHASQKAIQQINPLHKNGLVNKAVKKVVPFQKGFILNKPIKQSAQKVRRGIKKILHL